MQNSSGAWVSGVTFTTTLAEGALFDTNNNGKADAGESQTCTGTTGTSPVSLNWVATPGVHDVKANTVYPVTTANLLALRAGAGVQDTLKKGPGDPETLTSMGVTFRAVGGFQPTITTRVSDTEVDKGQTVSDAVTFAEGKDSDGNQTGWVQGADVQADGVLYGPFDTPQTATAAGTHSPIIPADAPVATDASGNPITSAVTMTWDLWSAGTRSITAVPSGAVSQSGYYTWVWQIDKDNQPGDNGEYILSDYSDGFDDRVVAVKEPPRTASPARPSTGTPHPRPPKRHRPPSRTNDGGFGLSSAPPTLDGRPPPSVASQPPHRGVTGVIPGEGQAV